MRCATIALGLALALPAESALAQPVEIPQDTVACELSGLSLDKDPAGLNVRAGPSLSATVVARLPIRPQVENGSNPEFRILGFKDGWFLIEGASYGDYGDPPPAKPLYAGKGWVSGSKLGGGLIGAAQSSALYSEPREDAPRAPTKAKVDSVEVRALLACRDDWVKVDANIGRGWAHGLCANQVTTCN